MPKGKSGKHTISSNKVKKLRQSSWHISFLRKNYIKPTLVIVLLIISVALYASANLHHVTPSIVLASSTNPCASAACGAGGYCGGNCSVTGPTNFLYQCSGTNGIMQSEEFCNYGCHTNSSGSDYCNSGASATSKSYTQCGSTTGACVNPTIPISNLVQVTQNAQSTSGNWLCKDMGISSNCGPTLTPIPPGPTATPAPIPTPTPQCTI